jgi:hypothetical protein
VREADHDFRAESPRQNGFWNNNKRQQDQNYCISEKELEQLASAGWCGPCFLKVRELAEEPEKAGFRFQHGYENYLAVNKDSSSFLRRSTFISASCTFR